MSPPTHLPVTIGVYGAMRQSVSRDQVCSEAFKGVAAISWALNQMGQCHEQCAHLRRAWLFVVQLLTGKVHFLCSVVNMWQNMCDTELFRPIN